MGYRIAISLTKYFTDERSYCYLHVDNKYEFVSDLQDYLRNLFEIKGGFCLLNDNFYLPNEENINIIKDGETVSVIPLQNDWRQKKDDKKKNENIVRGSGTPKPSKKKKKKKNKENSDTFTDEVENMTQETEVEKISIDRINSISIEVHNDDKKEAMDVSVNSDSYDCQKNTSTKSTFIELCDLNEKASSQSNDNSDTNDIDDFRSISFTEKSIEMQNTLQLLKNRAMTLLNDNASKLVAGVSAGRINKRKRIRKRKNKNANLPNTTTDVSITTGKIQSTYSSVKKSHIRFSDSESPVIVQNEGYSKVQPEKPRMIHALRTDMELSNRSRSNSLSASYQSLNDLAACTKEDSLNDSSGVDKTLKLRINAIASDLKSYPPLGSALPVSKDIILFKMLKMDINYTPTISDYILALVIDVEESNSIVKLSIIDGHSQCTSPKGKFNIIQDEEGDGVGCAAFDSRQQNMLEVEWGRIVEARLVFP